MPPTNNTPALRGPVVLYARALVSELRWSLFPVRQILADGRCDCKEEGCKDVGKHPRIRWTQDATLDEKEVIRLWTKYPNDGIGVATGPKSKLWVLDVDPRSGGFESLAELEKKNAELPRTITVNTGSGGLHIYFKYPNGEYRNTAGVLGKGLDTRGNGGYVVAPPSMHKSGNRYTWKHAPANTELAEVPEWLLRVLVPQRTRTQPSSGKKKLGLHAARRSWADSEALLEQILKHNLIQWMREYPDDVSREVWRGVAQNLACATIDHETVLEKASAAFHEISEDYTGYSWAQTEKTFRDAVSSVRTCGPMSFARMVECGLPKEYWSAMTTNLIHAAQTTLYVKSLERFK